MSGIALGALGAWFATSSGAHAWLPVLALCLCIYCDAAGLQPVPFVVMTEMFSFQVCQAQPWMRYKRGFSPALWHHISIRLVGIDSIALQQLPGTSTGDNVVVLTYQCYITGRERIGIFHTTLYYDLPTDAPCTCPQYRGTVTSIVTAFACAIVSVELRAFHPLAASAGLHLIFGIFSAVCLASTAYIACCVPETRRRTIDEIYAEFRGKRKDLEAHVTRL